MRKATNPKNIEKDGTSHGTQAIDRALSILTCFNLKYPTWSAADLSERLSLTLPTTQRILRAMESKGFLAPTGETGKYQLSLRIFELGAVVENRMTIIKYANEALMKLRDETNETVHLVIVEADEMLYVKKIESLDAFGILSSVGVRRPLIAGSLGKAILSTFNEERLNQYINTHKLVQYTAKSITDKNQYMEEIAKTKREGFAVDYETLFDGVCGIAAPIVVGDAVVGGIALVFPSLNYDEKKVSEWGKMVRQVGLSISHRLFLSENKDRLKEGKWF